MYKIFWLTGLPCSGKTTIAKELAKNIHAEILDGDGKSAGKGYGVCR